jgi:hypothetical protein
MYQPVVANVAAKSLLPNICLNSATRRSRMKMGIWEDGRGAGSSMTRLWPLRQANNGIIQSQVPLGIQARHDVKNLADSNVSMSPSTTTPSDKERFETHL